MLEERNMYFGCKCSRLQYYQILQDAQLSQRDRAAGCVIVFAKSRRLHGRQYFTDLIGLSSTTVIQSASKSTNHSSQKTRLNDLSYDIKIWTDLSSILSQSTRLTDRRTDGETDGQTEFSSLDRVCIACSAVIKIGQNLAE